MFVSTHVRACVSMCLGLSARVCVCVWEGQKNVIMSEEGTPTFFFIKVRLFLIWRTPKENLIMPNLISTDDADTHSQNNLLSYFKPAVRLILRHLGQWWGMSQANDDKKSDIMTTGRIICNKHSLKRKFTKDLANLAHATTGLATP